MRLAPGLLLAAWLVRPALAAPPDYGSLDIHAQLDALTDDQRARFHIAQAYWVPAGGDVAVDFAYILGSLEGFATYNDDGSLVTEGLTEIPTSYLLRVPDPWNGRLVAVIHGGSAPHTRFFRYEGMLLEAGFAVFIVNHPSPGFPGFPWESFRERPRALTHAYFSGIHFVKDLVAEAFAPAAFTLFFGGSRGVGRGGGLLAARHGNPVDGYVLFIGGAGRKIRLEGRIAALAGDNLIPLTGQPTGYPIPLDDAYVADLADQIGFADPDYRAYVLAAPSTAEAQNRILAYRIADRPVSVQRDWEDTVFDPRIQRPTIVATGTDDQDTWAADSVTFVQKIVDAGRAGSVRLYVAPGRDHGGFTDESIYNAILLMDDWVERGVQPQTLVIDDTLSVPNNCQLGYPSDPLQYFFCQFAGDCP